MRDLAGVRFGSRVVTGLAYSKYGHCFWHVHCDCGDEGIARGDKLKQGKSNSCGCERNTGRTPPDVTGRRKWGPHTANNRTYRSWAQMIQRCYNEAHIHYEYYGGCGITVCERWRNSFGAFLEDMGERPRGKSIDRYPNKFGSYEPGNCRWATHKEQMNNKRPWGTVAAKKFPKKIMDKNQKNLF